MPSTVASKRAVFQTIADSSDFYWPYYRDPETEHTSSDLGAFEHDVHRLACEWFKHDAHDDVEAFISWCPLYHLDFSSHDAHPSWHAKTKPAVPMIRALMVMEFHDWEYETALIEYLDDHPGLVDALGFETTPDQSTIWRARHERFSDELLRLVEECVTSLCLLAAENGVSVPVSNSSSLETGLPPLEEPDDGPTQREILQRADELTAEAQRRIFPAFSLDRAEQASIPEDAFWELQTYLGLGENLCANEGARSFLTESTRKQTPLGHNHRHHIRQFSIEVIRKMYHEAMQRLLAETTSRSHFLGAASVAIDTTESSPFTGDRTGHEDEIPGTKEDTNEYAYQWASIQTVGWIHER